MTSKRYEVWSQSRDEVIRSFAVIDTEVYPKDMKKRLRGEPEWRCQEIIASYNIIVFHVTEYQSEKHARARIHEYVDFMNKQDDAMKVAAALIGL